ncbi:MAG: hypothetical protein ACUVTR_02190 [Dehalococcoidia bacterium]
MTIELSAGEQKQLNVALTPIFVAPQLAITELFIATMMTISRTSADDRLYICIKNNGTSQVSGTLNVYDWQAWWEQPPGDDRRWDGADFTIAAGELFRFAARSVRHLVGDLTYMRANVIVNGVEAIATPFIYIQPGKQYTGSEEIAVGQCTYTRPGLAVLWYSQDSDCDIWEGFIHTPKSRPYLHEVHWGSYKTGNYGRTESWPAVFVPIIDPKLISGATYYAYISGGSAGAAWRACRFSFVQG